MKINLDTGVGYAALAFVANYTGHTKLCFFFLTCGIIGFIVALLAGVITEIAEGVTDGKTE